MAIEKKSTAKNLAIRAIEGLPDDATLEDAIECLTFVREVEAGIEEADGGELIAHEQVKQHFQQWLR